jgi:hypothetical protein
MTTIVGLPPRDAESSWLHLVLALRDPHVRVALILSEPLEPAIVSYYLELIGVGAGDRLALFSLGDRGRRPVAAKLLDRSDVVPAVRAFVGEDDGFIHSYSALDPADRAAGLALGLPVFGLSQRFAEYASEDGRRHLLRAARVPTPASEIDALATPSVQVRIERDARVSVVSAHDRVEAGCRFPAVGDWVDELYRCGARVGAILAAEGAVGRFAVDFVVDEDDQAFAVGITPREDEFTHAHATLLALRANALRACDGVQVPGCSTWRQALAKLRAAGVLWDPVGRAGVVAYALDSFERTGELGLVALGNFLSEADAVFYAALTALGAIHADTVAGSAR